MFEGHVTEHEDSTAEARRWARRMKLQRDRETARVVELLRELDDTQRELEKARNDVLTWGWETTKYKADNERLRSANAELQSTLQMSEQSRLAWLSDTEYWQDEWNKLKEQNAELTQAFSEAVQHLAQLKELLIASQEQNAELQARLDRATGLIKSYEWIWDEDRGRWYCWKCRYFKEDDHAPDCPAFTPDGTVK